MAFLFAFNTKPNSKVGQNLVDMGMSIIMLSLVLAVNVLERRKKKKKERWKEKERRYYLVPSMLFVPLLAC